MEAPDNFLKVEGTIKLNNYENDDTNLAGCVRTHTTMHPADHAEFCKELQELMMKHKVIKIDVCFDPFKM